MEIYEQMMESFIISTMHPLMYDQDELANISFVFKEDEAYKKIYECMAKNISGNANKFHEIEMGLKNINHDKPIMYINDYKKFFTLLYELLKSYKYAYDKERKTDSDINILYYYVIKLFWLKMTPDDFINPEKFLEKNIDMYYDTTFDDYNYITNMQTKIKDYQIYAKNQLAKCYDESIREMDFTIRKGDAFMHLPLVRYGIYKKGKTKICEIASIQDKNAIDYYEYDKKIYKDINRYKYKLNKDVDEELINKVEPNKLLSLLLFIKLLDKKKIYNISIPSMYVLDFEYHEKRDNNTKSLFQGKWRNMDIIMANQEAYNKELLLYLKEIDKQELISENKTTNFIKLFERLMYHISDSEIISYPMELSSYMNIKINSLNDINGEEVSKILKKSR